MLSTYEHWLLNSKTFIGMNCDFSTLSNNYFVFPAITAILRTFLAICFQPFGVLLLLAQCSVAGVITSRLPPWQHLSISSRAESDGKTEESWRSRELVTAARVPTYASPNVRSGGPWWDQMDGGKVHFYPKFLPRCTFSGQKSGMTIKNWRGGDK